jgi:PAS domain S-box-containing protein
MNNYQNIDDRRMSDDERNEIYKTIWVNSPDAFILLDYQGNIVLYNDAMIKMFGLSPDEMQYKKSVFRFLKKEDWSRAKEDFNYAVEYGELKDCEYVAVRGEYGFPVSISYRKVNFDSRPGDYVIVVGKDITKTKIDERAMRKAKEKAEIADKLKTSFLANMSHEIRTPINAVIGFADLLNDPDLLEDEKREYINTIQVNGELLLKLINDIIDIAKIESGQLKISKNEFSVEQLFEEVYLSSRNMLVTMEKPHLILDYHIDDNLKGKSLVTDQYRLIQIINNLINNAIKFTDQGRIDFGARLNENGKPEFWVKDTGIGIPEKDIDLIFDRFGQVQESLDRNIGGTGLGLSITKSLVEILGGRIKVKSEVGKGSEFVFTVDAINKESDNRSSTSKKINLSGKKILIVEDTESNYRLLNILLEKNGAETIWALTGTQGVSICKNSKDIDLVLMDINLPDINGYEATSQIKAFKPNLPVVAQTAYAMAGEKSKSLEFGCDDYISKPIIPEKLFAVISALI